MKKNALVDELHPPKLRTKHLFKIMKITFILLFASIFSLYAGNGYSQDVKVTLSAKNASMTKVLDAIESQTDYLFIINSNVNTARKVSVEAKQTAVTKILNDMLKGTNVHYAVEGMYIVLSNKRMDKESVTELVEKELTITGKVSDSTGEPLLGVNILLKGTTIGVISDFDGNYSIKVPEGKGELVFSYIGFQQKVVSLNGKSIVNVTMSEDSKVLGEVVVTAMGIERKAKSLTYATQTVGGKELTRAKDANFVNSLQGKSAGLVITPNATGAGGSSKVLLRGNSSVLGNNSPLIVLDGIPMPNRDGGQIGGDIAYGGGSDGGDGLSNINPDDIASITVLKGANAAALYGSSAANGVLIINTKKGYEGKLSVEISSSSLFEKPLLTPEFQNTYSGDLEEYKDGIVNPTTRRRINNFAWGEKINTLSDKTLADIPYARRSAQDNVKNYLGVGTNFNNTIAVSGGSKVGQSYFSYGNTTASGMLPGNKFSRHNVTFRQNLNFFKDRLKLNFSANYINQKSNNKATSGFFGNQMYNVYLMPRNADVRYFKNNYEVQGNIYANNPEIKDAAGNRRVIGRGPVQQWPWLEGENSNNPYWLANRLLSESVRDRFYGSVGASVTIIEGLIAQARLNYDSNLDAFENKTYHGTKGKSFYNSVYGNTKAKSTQIFADFLVSYMKRIKDFEVSASVGGSTKKDDWNNLASNYWMGDTTAIPNVFVPQNVKYPASAGNSVTFDNNWEKALYATVQVGYKDMAYIDFSVRNDWSKAFQQFAKDGVPSSYAYYALGGNVLLDQLFNFNSEKVNLLKLRVSYSQVGNSIPNIVYAAQGIDFSTGGIKYPQYSNFKDPKPETLISTEFGIEGLLFNSSLDFDLTLYQNTMHNQYLTISAATGGSTPINTGQIRNRGIEFTAGYLSSFTKDFSWKTGFNISYNENKILETYGDDEVIKIDGGLGSGLKIKFMKGKPYGDLYANTFRKDKDGKIKTNRYGAPIITSDAGEYIGNANAKTHFGWNNTFNYKDFSLYVLIDGKIGGTVVSLTESKLDAYGVSKRTGDARDANVTYMKKEMIGSESVIVPVPGIVMPDGAIAPVKEYYEAIGGGLAALSEYAYNATNVRLREISLGYTFRSLFGNGKDLSLSLVGRNLFFIYKDSPVDPDISVSTANGFGGIDVFSMPTTRSIGFNIKASF